MRTNVSNERGFTLAELLIGTTVTLAVLAASLTTFRNALNINDAGSQLADTAQNLRAGTNTLVKDILQAGRVIGPEGIPVPSGAGAAALKRPGPPGSALTFNLATTTNLPDITTGYSLGPTVDGSATDMITIMTVDAFMPIIQTPPVVPATPTTTEGTIAADGSNVTLPATSLWLTGDTVNDTPAVQVGDLVLFKNPSGTAMQTVTSKDATHIYFGANDPFMFNQRTAPQGTVMQIKGAGAAFQQTTLFRALMITYYVDAVTVPGVPRLVRRVNNFAGQALAGVVEDLDLTYDLVDGVNNPAQVTSLPYTDAAAGVTYNSNQIRKVNLHVGVRSEQLSRQAQDYIRNHINTAVDVRSLASVDRYVTQ